MNDVKAIETTTFQNEKWKTFRPSSGAKYMSEEKTDKVKGHKFELTDGYEVFHWPEFQALAKRLGITMTDPIRDVTILVPLEGPVVITVETLGLDITKKR